MLVKDILTEAVKINYDSWTTKPPKNLNEYHWAVLEVMADRQPRERSAMLYAAGMEPNPKSKNGFAGWNRVDYDLYKMGYIEAVADNKFKDKVSSKKTFRITPAGLKMLKSNIDLDLREDIDKDTFVKLLKKKGVYDITTTGSKFEATIIEPYGSDLANKILKTQQAKIKEAGEILGVTWELLYAKQFMQAPHYYYRNRADHPAWTYVLVGHDDKGNEVSYWKYEGAVAGGGQSHIFVNKDKNSKIKLSDILYPKNRKWAVNYIQTAIENKAKRDAEQAELKTKKKLTNEEIGQVLQRSGAIKSLVKNHGAELKAPNENYTHWRLVFPETKNYGGKIYEFRPSTQGRVKLAADHLQASRYSGPFQGPYASQDIYKTLQDAVRATIKSAKHYLKWRGKK